MTFMGSKDYSWFRGSIDWELVAKLKELNNLVERNSKMPVVTHKNFAVSNDFFDLTVRLVDGEGDLKVVFLKGKKHFELSDLERAINDLRNAAKA